MPGARIYTALSTHQLTRRERAQQSHPPSQQQPSIPAAELARSCARCSDVQEVPHCLTLARRHKALYTSSGLVRPCSALVTTSPGSLLSPAPHGLSTVYTSAQVTSYNMATIVIAPAHQQFLYFTKENLKTSMIKHQRQGKFDCFSLKYPAERGVWITVIRTIRRRRRRHKTSRREILGCWCRCGGSAGRAGLRGAGRCGGRAAHCPCLLSREPQQQPSRREQTVHSEQISRQQPADDQTSRQQR